MIIHPVSITQRKGRVLLLKLRLSSATEAPEDEKFCDFIQFDIIQYIFNQMVEPDAYRSVSFYQMVNHMFYRLIFYQRYDRLVQPVDESWFISQHFEIMSQRIFNSTNIHKS